MLPPPRARIRAGSACFEKVPWSCLSVLCRKMCGFALVWLLVWGVLLARVQKKQRRAFFVL